MLGVPDLQKVIDRLTGSQCLSDQEIQLVIQNLLEEADLDDDGALSFAEFEHIIDKSSDFVKWVILHQLDVLDDYSQHSNYWY